MSSKTFALVFLAVVIFLIRGLKVAFQDSGGTLVDIELPVLDKKVSLNFSASLAFDSIISPIETVADKNPGVVITSETNLTANASITQQEGEEEFYEWSPRPYEPNPRPPVENVVKDWVVTGDPQWLINFAIAAFPKCGTSTLMHYFSNNPEVQIPPNERCELGANQHVPLLQDMYEKFPPGDYVRGIKCPSNLENDLSKKNYEKFFPKTDMIVGIRHPIKWFESFYNHRVQNQHTMRNMSELTGACGKKSYGVCTNRAAFQVSLSQLGRTPLRRGAERELFPPWGHRWYGRKLNLTNRIFFYEVEQLNEKNETRAKAFRKDLQRFLYLRHELPPMVWFKPGRKGTSTTLQKKVDSMKIDICDDEFLPVRTVLLEHAVNVSNWVQQYFLPSETVFVSSRDHLENILDQWKVDPCADGGSYKANAAAMNCTKYGCFLKNEAHPTNRV